MKNVTRLLSDEHQNILRVIDMILGECEELSAGKECDPDFFVEAIDFIKNYADRFHHAKEEDVLFRAMSENADSMHCNPISVMLYEHDSGREYVSGMEEGLTQGNKEMVIENARGYCVLLQQHIYKEDNVLYPMAEESLTDQQKERVYREYNEVTASFSEDDISHYLALVNRTQEVRGE